MRRLKELGAEEFGIHAFLASNTLSNDYYPALARILFQLAAELKEETGCHITFINLSGGVGVPYRPEQPANDIAVIGEGVRRAYEEVLVPAGMDDVSICTELGRFMLAPYAGADLLYAESVELETPADCVRALQESRVDVIPLDSFFHLLLADEYPELGRRLVILGASPFTSMPFLAGSPELAPHAVRALRDALELWSLSPAYEDIRKALCLRGFAFPSPADYAALAVQEAEALRLGYPCPA